MNQESGIKNRIKSIIHKAQGFTLVELLLVFSFMAGLTSVGIAGFINYNRSQAVISSVNDVASLLTLAKSRALYQVTPCQVNPGLPLDGYQFTLCYSGACLGPYRSSDYYEVSAVCGGNKVFVQSKKLPEKMSFDSARTSVTSFFFPVITGGVSTPGTIAVAGYGTSREVQIDTNGNIQAVRVSYGPTPTSTPQPTPTTAPSPTTGSLAPTNTPIPTLNPLSTPVPVAAGLPCSSRTSCRTCIDSSGTYKCGWDGTNCLSGTSASCSDPNAVWKWYKCDHNECPVPTGTPTPTPTPTPISQVRVFVSSQNYNGNLGGLSGADTKCQTLATNAGLGGTTWKAWLSDTNTSASSRLMHATVPYVLSFSGNIVADNWTDLTTVKYSDQYGYSLRVPIAYDEYGVYKGNVKVWTFTTSGGLGIQVEPEFAYLYSCNNWTNSSRSYVGYVGATFSIDSSWTQYSTNNCEEALPIYCFEH